MEMNTQPKGPPIRVELGEKEAEGTYSNLAFVSHTASEFILDFARMLPGSPKARVHARVIMTPQHTRALLGALEKTIAKFEEQFGPIKMQGQEGSARPIGFQAAPAPDAPASSQS
jgi:hypothetical protein